MTTTYVHVAINDYDQLLCVGLITKAINMKEGKEGRREREREGGRKKVENSLH